MPVEKKWFESKVVLVNLMMAIALGVGQFQPSVADFIKTYFAEAGMGWAFVNVLLRVFKSNVVL